MKNTRKHGLKTRKVSVSKGLESDTRHVFQNRAVRVRFEKFNMYAGGRVCRGEYSMN